MLKALLSILCLTSFFTFSGQADMKNSMICLGNEKSPITWVYLCGLLDSFDSPEEIENRKTLDRIGKRINIRFLAIHPFERCEPAGNKLCWRHYTELEALETYKLILETIKEESIAGIIGFSNGGYFLNYLAQMKKLEWPVISIGAGGTVEDANHPNHITLIIGKNEITYHSAIKFMEEAKKTSLTIHHIEHEYGHIIPEDVLQNYLLSLEVKP